jgi:GNAT superfamily N-acetyltransferase
MAGTRGPAQAEARVTPVTCAGEVEELLGVLEGLAQNLGWRPGGQLRADCGAALHLAARANGRTVGGLQMVFGAAGQTPPHQRVWPDVASVEAAAHVTILALHPEWRGRAGLMWPLCVALWRVCKGNGVQALLLEATPPTLRVYRRLGFPLEVIGELRMHWGEECHLCRMGMAEVEAVLRGKAERSPAYRKIIEDADLGSTGRPLI